MKDVSLGYESIKITYVYKCSEYLELVIEDL